VLARGTIRAAEELGLSQKNLASILGSPSRLFQGFGRARSHQNGVVERPSSWRRYLFGVIYRLTWLSKGIETQLELG
jgi:hypothetical protein